MIKLNFHLPNSKQWREPIAWCMAVFVVLVFVGMVYYTWDSLQPDRHPVELVTATETPAVLPTLDLPSQNRSVEPSFTVEPDQVGKSDPFK